MNIFKNQTLNRWLTTTDHKDVGLMYFFATLLFGFIGLVLSLLIRIQLYQPNNGTAWLDWAPGDDPGAFYNSIVTMHGAVMVLFFVSPLSFGFANYVVPLQIGAKDMAFPRLNALSFWTFLFGGLVAASGFLFGVINNLSLERSGQLGNLIASETIKIIGARPELNLLDLIQKNYPDLL